MAVASTYADHLERALEQIGNSFVVVNQSGRLEVVDGPPIGSGPTGQGQVVAVVPACRLEDMGDPSFVDDHRLRYPCMSGAMANGIGSVEVVEAMGRRGFLGIGSRETLRFGAYSARFDELVPAERIYRKRDFP